MDTVVHPTGVGMIRADGSVPVLYCRSSHRRGNDSKLKASKSHYLTFIPQAWE